MQQVEIKAKEFFAMIKERQLSMWDVLQQMIDGEEKKIKFISDDGSLLMQYVLPKTLDKLKIDQKEFARLFAEQMEQLN